MADQTKDLETVRMVKVDLSKSAFERASMFLNNAKRPGYFVSASSIFYLCHTFNEEDLPIDSF